MYGPTDGVFLQQSYDIDKEREEMLFASLDQIKKGYFAGLDNVVFLHTGGSAALFGYPETFELHGYT